MRNQKGFTLIELLIVVAILFILGSIAYGAWQNSNGGGDTNMGTQGGTLADAPISNLVCKDKDGAEVWNEPAIPGEAWHADGDNYVTTDATGKPHIVREPDGGDCTIS